MPIITNAHQVNFQIKVLKSDLPKEDGIEPDELLPMLGFLPTYTDESAEID